MKHCVYLRHNRSPTDRLHCAAQLIFQSPIIFKWQALNIRIKSIMTQHTLYSISAALDSVQRLTAQFMMMPHMRSDNNH